MALRSARTTAAPAHSCMLFILLLAFYSWKHGAWALTAETQAVQVVAKGASLPASLYRQATFLYKFVRPEHSVSYTSTGSGTGKRELIADNIHFAGTDSLFSSNQYSDYPDIQMYAAVAAAVVPVVNIPAIDRASDALTLPGQVLADIFLGNVTRWRDPAILAVNPTLRDTLPDKPIIVCVREDKSGTTEIFTRGLVSLSNGEFERAVGISSLPDWPVSAAGGTLLKLDGNSGVAARVHVTEYSIGYVVYEAAVSRGLQLVKVQNLAGRPVLPTPRAVGHALMELGGNFDERFTADLTGPKGTFAWPISGYTYLAMRKNTTIDECVHRTAVVEYWTWFYTSETVRETAEGLGFATLPGIVRDEVLAKLQSDILCTDAATVSSNGHAVRAYSPPPVAMVTGAGSKAASFLMSTYTSAYSVVHEGTEMAYRPVDWLEGTDIRTSLSARDTSFAVFLQGAQPLTVSTATPEQQTILPAVIGQQSARRLQSSSTNLQAKNDQAQLLVIPIGLVAAVPVYHLEAIGSHQLVLDPITLAQIYLNRITTWSHANIQALNPAVAHLLPDQTISVLVSGSVSEAYGILTRVLAAISVDFDDMIGHTGVDRWPADFTRVDPSAKLLSTVEATDGTLGFALDVGNIKANTVAMRLDGSCTSSTAGSYCDVSLEAQHITACANTSFDENSYLYTFTRRETTRQLLNGPSEGLDSRCWPFTAVLNSALQASYFAPAGEICSKGKRVSELLQWMHKDQVVTDALTALNFAAVSPAEQAVLRARLKAITCNDQPVGRVFCRRGEQRVSESQCVPCVPGTYDRDGDGECSPCPLGAECAGGSALAATKGYWQGDGNKFYRCTAGVCCPAGGCDLEKTDVPYLAAHPRCDASREQDSLLCEACREGTSYFAGQCRQCDGINWWFFIGLFFGGAMIVMLMVNSSGGRFAYFELWTDYLQLVGLVVGGERLAAVYLQIFTLDPSILSAVEMPCIAPMSRYSSHVVSIFWPLLLLAQLLTLFCVHRIRRWRRRRRCAPAIYHEFDIKTKQIDFKFLQGVWRLVMIAYTAIAVTGLSFFECLQVNDVRVLATNHGILCDTAGHSVALLLGGSVVLATTLVLPVSISLLMHKANGGEISWAAFVRGLRSIQLAVRAQGRRARQSSTLAVAKARSILRKFSRQRMNASASTASIQGDAEAASRPRASSMPGQIPNTRAPNSLLSVVQQLRAENGAMEPTATQRSTVFSRMLEELSDWIKPVFRVWFEPYFLLRRTVMVALSVFIHDDRLRACMLLGWAAVLLYAHSLLQPFSSFAKNTSHTALSVALVVVAGLDIAARDFSDAGDTAPRADVSTAIYVIIVLPALPLMWYLLQTFYKSEAGVVARNFVTRVRRFSSAFRSKERPSLDATRRQSGVAPILSHPHSIIDESDDAKSAVQDETRVGTGASYAPKNDFAAPARVTPQPSIIEDTDCLGDSEAMPSEPVPSSMTAESYHEAVTEGSSENSDNVETRVRSESMTTHALRVLNTSPSLEVEEA